MTLEYDDELSSCGSCIQFTPGREKLLINSMIYLSKSLLLGYLIAVALHALNYFLVPVCTSCQYCEMTSSVDSVDAAAVDAWQVGDDNERQQGVRTNWVRSANTSNDGLETAVVPL